MDDNVFILDAGSFELFCGAGEEGGNDLVVPAGVDDADSEVGACGQEVSMYGAVEGSKG